ncbi:hypothetical protein AXF42_Ash014752 [Apostasia shenzhenica]|uniref:Uncharacterized protein n=1 Tax=Apostasia shenzhenica TaxID=1088818 RepID=A0A2H9ZWA7_9ASPA|nr:hypothetical protein AXF42_Ash014752 [Apostasia shenzhenica]
MRIRESYLCSDGYSPQDLFLEACSRVFVGSGQYNFILIFRKKREGFVKIGARESLVCVSGKSVLYEERRGRATPIVTGATE